MKKKSVIIVAIILMAVGFATLATNLIINGNVEIGNKAEDYEIIFTSSILEGVENNSLIIDNGKKIRYETKVLMNVGDTSELIYEISNNSREYDGEVSISCTVKGDVTHTDLYSIDTTNTPDVIKAKTSEVGSIKITLNQTTTEEIREEFECELNINALERTTPGEKEYKEEILNGTDPVLSGDLIPVKLSSDGEVTKADTSKEWYNYERKNWANAVILTEEAKTYSVGDKIEEADIESYFVWVPKYKYKLWNVGTTEENKGKHSIEIEFGTENTTDIEGESCVTPMISGESGNCNNGEYMTHPAFISLGVNGIWVGKFEVGYKDAATTSEAQVNSEDSTKVIIKPNVYSWRENTVNNMFMASYNYKRELGSHMMKNTEWGAVAYLSHSIYGINEEVNINNNSSYKTGYSANLNTNQSSFPGTYGDSSAYNQPYNTETGYKASTTGNINGIYDMSGGTHEYMASYINEKFGSSGFTNETIKNSEYTKYLDVYNISSEINTNQYRILGDTTGEMGPFLYYKDGDNVNRWHNSWYGDSADFVGAAYPWFNQGGNYNNGVRAGQLSFNRGTGDAYSDFGFRLVLTY